ncbi:MAG: diacylglycerol kinase [Oceanipulchritudo sp.]
MSEEQSKTEGESWAEHVLKATGYSMAGIRATLKHEMAFRIEVAAFIVLTPAALLVPVEPLVRFLVVASMLLVLLVECLNSSLEWIVDYISHDHHPYAKRAKDMGSAAVFFALLNAGLFWGYALLSWGGVLS